MCLLRWDKGAADVTTVEELTQLVRENKGMLAATRRGDDAEAAPVRKAAGKKKAGSKAGAGRTTIVSHFLPVDLSGKQQTEFVW